MDNFSRSLFNYAAKNKKFEAKRNNFFTSFQAAEPKRSICAAKIAVSLWILQTFY